MAEYIERGALMQFPIRRNHYDRKNGNKHFINGIESVLEYAENLPAADVAPVVHGRWDDIPNAYMSVVSKTGTYHGNATNCSVCLEVNPNAFKTNYCPNCGAKMDGGA